VPSSLATNGSAHVIGYFAHDPSVRGCQSATLARCCAACSKRSRGYLARTPHTDRIGRTSSGARDISMDSSRWCVQTTRRQSIWQGASSISLALRFGTACTLWFDCNPRASDGTSKAASVGYWPVSTQRKETAPARGKLRPLLRDYAGGAPAQRRNTQTQDSFQGPRWTLARPCILIATGGLRSGSMPTPPAGPLRLAALCVSVARAGPRSRKQKDPDQQTGCKCPEA
jgi:hypothetical protein